MTTSTHKRGSNPGEGVVGAATEIRFVEFFRACAPYVHRHRGATFVISFGGEAMQSRGFAHLIQDVALLHALGIRIVLVHGARPQIEERLKVAGAALRYERGIRVTDGAALTAVKEASGRLRVEIEALLSMGVESSPMAGARLRVSGGNFVIARPIGVVDGVDYQHTGIVRRVDGGAIKERLDAGAIVLIPPVGYSVTGEIFNLHAQEVAAQVAVGVGAEKLIGLVEGRGLVDRRRRGGLGEVAVEEAERLLRNRRLREDLVLHLNAAVAACRGGVPRVHLIERRTEGGLLLELFTRAGIGTLVTAEAIETPRDATLADVAGVVALVRPLEDEGLLVYRPGELIEEQIERFVVIERDGLVIATAALLPYADGKGAEIACVAVHPDYRDAGRGDVLLMHLERRARAMGAERLYLLTTRTAHWFRERGFAPGRAADLPRDRRRTYDRKRGSKVLVKGL